MPIHTITEPLQHTSTSILLLDIVALIYFVAMWMGYNTYGKLQYFRRPNLMCVMDKVRGDWMQSILSRGNRIADANLLGNLLRSISFFANTSIFILMGLITILGYRDSAIEMLNTVPFAVSTGALLWEVKVLTLLVIFIYAFFKFTWSQRQYNYCCILVGAAPMPDNLPENAQSFGENVGAVIKNAGKHFDMGMRAYYYGLATISWFIHPILFIGATTLVVYILYRREFRSHTLINLQKLQ